jgi:hypothetical protein
VILLVTGDRNWDNDWIIRSEFAVIGYDKIDLVIHGDARGADTIAAAVALQHEIPTLAVPARWSKYPKAAGPIRNSLMLKFMGIVPTYVLAFHNNIESSKGTKDMLTKVKKLGIPYKLVTTHPTLKDETSNGKAGNY